MSKHPQTSRSFVRSLRLTPAIVLLAAAPALADAMAHISAVPRGEVAVTFTAQDGKAETHVFKGDTSVELRTSGPHKVAFTFDGKTYQTDVDLPLAGNVQLVFDPAGTPPIQFFALAVEEVTVTAERVAANLQKVPVAVTALTSRAMEVQGLTNVQQVSHQAPNLWMEKNTGTSSGSRAAIRGIGEDESFFTSDTPVGIYIDDVYIPRQTGAQFDLYELERIEVLRGPQGTLYGRNTSAGAIKLVSKQPGNQLAANFDVTLGSFNRTDFRGSLTVPLGQHASIHAAGIVRKHDGYDLNLVNGQRVNDQDVRGGRLALRFLPSSKVDVLVSGDYLQERSTPGFAVGIIPQGPFINGFGVGKLDFSKQVDGDSDVHTLRSDLTDPINRIDQKGISANVSWSPAESVTIKSISAYRTLYNVLLLDADGDSTNAFGLKDRNGVPLPALHLFQNQHQNQASQEVQLQGRAAARLGYIAGVYFFHEENTQRTENIIFAPLGANNFTDTAMETNSAAVFGSGTLQASSRLSVTVGGRYTRDTKEFDTATFRPSGAPLLACVGPAGQILGSTRACGSSDPAGSVTTPVAKRLDPTWDAFTPRLAVDYAAARDLLTYFSVARGFTSGAFDGRANEGITVLPLKAIPPERLVAYEGGVKSDWLQNRLRINAAAFLNAYDDLQGSGTDPSGNFVLFSVGDIRTKGAEFEFKVAAAPGLDLAAQLSFLRTEYQTVNFNQAVDCAQFGTGSKELELKFSPHTSFWMSATYSVPRPALGGRWSIGGSVSRKGPFYHNSCNADAASQLDPYTLADASLSYETQSGWRITLAGENLTNEEYLIGSFAIPGLYFASGYMNPPRRLSVTFRYAFDGRKRGTASTPDAAAAARPVQDARGSGGR